MASAKFAKRTVNQSQSVIWTVKALDSVRGKNLRRGDNRADHGHEHDRVLDHHRGDSVS